MKLDIFNLLRLTAGSADSSPVGCIKALQMKVMSL